MDRAEKEAYSAVISKGSGMGMGKSWIKVGALVLVGSLSSVSGSIQGAEISVADPSPILWTALEAPGFAGTPVVDALSSDPVLKALFESDSGTQEHYTIREHTLRVFDVLAEQYAAHSTRFGFRVPSSIRWTTTLKMSLALHDIGKPIAIREGNRGRQREFTLPILQVEMARAGFRSEEISLASALVGQDLLGETLQGKHSLETALTQLESTATSAGMTLAEYFPLQLIFYVSDAASYPWVRENVFITEDSLLVPKSPVYRELLAKLYGTDGPSPARR